MSCHLTNIRVFRRNWKLKMRRSLCRRLTAFVCLNFCNSFQRRFSKDLKIWELHSATLTRTTHSQSQSTSLLKLSIFSESKSALTTSRCCIGIWILTATARSAMTNSQCFLKSAGEALTLTRNTKREWQNGLLLSCRKVVVWEEGRLQSWRVSARVARNDLTILAPPFR